MKIHQPDVITVAVLDISNSNACYENLGFERKHAKENVEEEAIHDNIEGKQTEESITDTITEKEEDMEAQLNINDGINSKE